MPATPYCNKTSLERIVVRGKFFFQGSEKFFLKGATYGPFREGSHGDPFPEKEAVKQDLLIMGQLGANCLRTFTVPPRWFLDLCSEAGVRVLSGIPWAQHVCFLKSASIKAGIRKAVAEGVRSCAGHPAGLAFLLGNEIPPDIVRWHGPEKIRGFLRELMDIAKQQDPECLVSYANFPSTEYLQVDFTDFVSFNVYLHNRDPFRRYLSRLHNIAGERPLVLTEFGIDSIREGEDTQASILDWQVRTCFESGLAGTTIFSFTDEWFTGGFDMEGWAFGLVGRDRRLKPAFESVRNHYTGPVPPPLPVTPMVSVVVCAYNAERTLQACLTSLEQINYPDYEIILINDGSTDRTAEIAASHPAVKTVSQPNLGLSTARNTGIAESSGEIIAFTDSDCIADPDWLTFLVATMTNTGAPAVGGPNYPPPESDMVPACVAVSPGGPTHVLLSDEIAEHIAGCNMAFRRETIQNLGGFDPHFRVAGDDVDLCWRLQDEGHQIAFSPAAMVWHFRRNTIAAYLKQQRGYGKAEALVYFKHPYRFNLLGQARWIGRIYGDLSSFLLSRRPVIYSGVFGRALFQTLYEPPGSMLACLPLTLEWNLGAVLFLLYALFAGGTFWLALIPFCFTIGTAMAGAMRAPLDPSFKGTRARLLIALLIYLGPIVRSWERYRWRISGYSGTEPIRFDKTIQRPGLSLTERAFFLDYWSEEGLEKESLLNSVMDFLIPRKYFVAIDQGWNDWDFKISRGIWSRAQYKVCSENHGGNKRRLRVRCSLKFSKPAVLALSLYGAAITAALLLKSPQAATAAGAAGAVNLWIILSQKFRLGRILHHVTERAAREVGLSPVGKADSAS